MNASNMNHVEIYKALGDPVRLKIVSRLASKSPLTLSTLSKNLGITRQGARKQIQVLVTAQMVKLKPKGRETEVALDTESLKVARQFIMQLEQQWDQRLLALKQFIEGEPFNS